MRIRNPKGALLQRPFFCLVTAILLQSTAVDTAFATCLKNATREAVKIASITDGDTVVLQDQRKVRIIGVNTPELNAQKPWSRALARRAANAVERWLEKQSSVYLVSGIDPFDHHQRSLAHLMGSSDQLLSEHLLQQGLAAASPVHPNTRCADHLAKQERDSRTAGSGVWRKENPWFVIDTTLNKRQHRGFRIVQAKLVNISNTKKKYTLVLQSGLRVNIRKSIYQSLEVVPKTGETIEVRGWVSFRSKQPSISLHHATNLSIL
ncbi:MAG: thermonuclease family protein [Gammaproteobacteria bacterium]|nr:thermonuclease family protein [Gammaproteobacteria bacterium]